ncbi:MAG: hypothetical protein B7X06_02595 [Verrucomicrobia bacterium 21-51-4]|nr:MAG: hypothetical protein B7X06_02595 [Verrucomicrobia bacterium 21-51-4]HQU09277.1 carbohydrate porin [Opitutales bacterium]
MLSNLYKNSPAAKLGRVISVAGALSLGALGAYAQSAPATTTNTAANASYSTELDSLRKEFMGQLDQIRSSYEKRINDLETEIHTLKQNDHLVATQQRAETAAQSAEDAALKASEAYTSTLASLDISEQWRDGVSTPWAEIDNKNKGFEFHGYLRSGFGVTGNGTAQNVFSAPLVGNYYSSYYRLGNETNTYGELIFTNHFFPKDPKDADAVQFKAQCLLAFSQNNGTDQNPAATGNGTPEIVIREVFAEATGVLKSVPSASFWAGQRYYLNPDIHINKLSIVDMSGYGGGIKDVQVGDLGKAAFAWIGGSIDNLNPDGTVAQTGIDDIPKNNLILSMEDIDVPFGKGLVWGTFTAASRGELDASLGGGNYPTNYGGAIGFVHTKKDFFGGFNQASIQYGYGSGSNFASTVRLPSEEGKNSWAFRVTEYCVVQPVQEFSVGGVILWQESDNGLPGNSSFRWISAGVRPVYHLNKYWSIALEGGIDYTKTQQLFTSGSATFQGANGTLYKLSPALQITPDWDFAVRPSIRLYVTYAYWTDGYVNLVGTPTYSNANDGIAAGMQFEAWW